LRPARGVAVSASAAERGPDRAGGVRLPVPERARSARAAADGTPRGARAGNGRNQPAAAVVPAGPERLGGIRGGAPARLRGPGCEKWSVPVPRGPLHRVAQGQGPAGGGAGRGRIHAPDGVARVLRGAAPGRLQRTRAALRGQGGHRLYRADAGRAVPAISVARARPVPVREAAARAGGGVSGPAAGRADLVSRMDCGRPLAPAGVSRVARRQAAPGGAATGALSTPGVTAAGRSQAALGQAATGASRNFRKSLSVTIPTRRSPASTGSAPTLRSMRRSPAAA